MSKYMSMYNESCISMKSQCESCCVVLNIIKSHAVTYLVMYLYYAYWPFATAGAADADFAPRVEPGPVAVPPSCCGGGETCRGSPVMIFVIGGP